MGLILVSFFIEFWAHLGGLWGAIWATIAAQDASRTAQELPKRHPGSGLQVPYIINEKKKMKFENQSKIIKFDVF